MASLTLLEGEVRMLARRVRELEELTRHLREAQTMRPELTAPASDDALVAELCTFIGGSAREIMSKDRTRRVVNLRRVLVRNLRSKSWSWARIAAVFRFSESAAKQLAR